MKIKTMRAITCTVIFPVIIIAAFSFFSVRLTGEEKTLSAEEIVDRSFRNSRLAGSEAILTLTLLNNKGQERKRKIAMVTKFYDNGQTEKKLLRFLSPADVKGTGFLTYDYEKKDDDMWLFMPALRKTRRIVSNEKSKSFMGSEFSYADLAPPTLSDFNYQTVGVEKIDEVTCWIIEIVAKNDKIADENGFSKKISYIGQQDFVARKGVYYDTGGKLEKEITVKDIQEVDVKNHKYKALHMVMENKQNGRKSIIKIEKIVFNPDVKDEYFTTRYLERF
jgi:outer membrane lipoprotein-sorting protein